MILILILFGIIGVEIRWSPRISYINNYLGGHSKLLLYYNSNVKGYITREYIELLKF